MHCSFYIICEMPVSWHMISIIVIIVEFLFSLFHSETSIQNPVRAGKQREREIE